MRCTRTKGMFILVYSIFPMENLSSGVYAGVFMTAHLLQELLQYNMSFSTYFLAANMQQ